MGVEQRSLFISFFVFTLLFKMRTKNSYSRPTMRMRSAWYTFVDVFSLEWWLAPRTPNGGAMVLARSLGVATELTVLTLLLWNALDPERSCAFAYTALWHDLKELAPWFAGATGGIYAALYARFSAQWSYLAGLYNQIKQTEVELLAQHPAVSAQAHATLAQWKAGYIEDAEELHLHTKSNVAAIIYHWGQDAAVANAFKAASPGGALRWRRLQRAVASAYEAATHKHLRHARRQA